MTPAGLQIALIADVFPPLRSSGAVQLRDLAQEFARQGHKVTVFIPAPELKRNWKVEHWNDVRIVRLKAPKTKDISYLRRTIGEFIMPFAMLRNLRKSPLRDLVWDGVVWYSPTIFLGPMANALKKKSGCRSYLIVRDIFPEWAVDMGLLSRGLPYRFFKKIEKYQYSVADVIGVQTPANVRYIDDWANNSSGRVEVLQNWLAKGADVGCSISISQTILSSRRIFVYAGNMGIAQGMGVLLDLAEKLRYRSDVGFLFVGRGSDSQRLKKDASNRGLDNVAFFDEIDPAEIPALYAQCHVGIVALDPRHKTHNIPGKFLSYMHAGLPVLACINPGNDLEKVIQTERVGKVCTQPSSEILASLALALLTEIADDDGIRTRCELLGEKLFMPETAVLQITNSLKLSKSNVSVLKS